MADTQKKSPLVPILIGCGALTAIILIGGGIAIYFGAKTVKDNFVTNSAQVLEKSREIMDYSFPGKAKGLSSVNVMGFQMAMVTDENTPPSVMLMLFSFPSSWGKNRIEQAMQQQMNRTQQTGDNMQFTSSKTVKGKLCGKAADIIVKHGHIQKNNIKLPVTSYQTMVESKSRLVAPMVITMGPDCKSKAKQLFNTLKCK